MKNNWIAFLVVLFFVYMGCKENPDVITPPPKSPEFILAVAIPAIVEYNCSTTVKFKVVNAKYVMVNGIKMATEDSIKFSSLINTTIVNIVAYGEGNTFTSETITIPVLPAPPVVYIPTVVDTICAKPMIRLTDSISFDNGLTWSEVSIAFGMKNSKTVFKKDFTYSSWKYPYGPENLAVDGVKWAVGENRTIDMGAGFEKFSITDATFIRFHENVWIDDKGKEHPLLIKSFYTR
jgi:hypothetical protein